MFNINAPIGEVRRWVSALKPVVASRTSLPVLGGVHIAATGGLARLTVTDLELYAQVTVPASGDGTAVMPFGPFNAALRGAKGNVTIDVTDESIRVVTSNGVAQLQPLPVDEYPRLPHGLAGGDEESQTGSFTVGVDRLSRVLIAAARDETRPILTGVLADRKHGRLVTTDSYRLAITPALVDIPNEQQSDIVPARFLRHVTKIADIPVVTVRLYERGAATEFNHGACTYRLESVLIEGEFPNYERLFATSFVSKLPLTADLLPALKALPAGAGEPVRFTVHDGVLRASVQDVGTSVLLEEPLPGYSDGSVAYNPGYLEQGLTAIGGAGEVHFNDHLKPASMSGNGVYYLIMPVRAGDGPAPVPDVDGPFTLEPPSAADAAPFDAPATTTEKPKRTGKAQLVEFVRRATPTLPDGLRDEATRLLEAA